MRIIIETVNTTVNQPGIQIIASPGWEASDPPPPSDSDLVFTYSSAMHQLTVGTSNYSELRAE